MFLKRLTMKGFKSFADATVLEFEQGVTAVVGPNGSGKSNVVDAVSWVLGAQSTRAMRSAKMEDVIFVGTSSRPALGRAEVALTLDNASGKLPIDGAEVTISRTLFRNGDSEYAINGQPCRLLDIQELLSDSGVGRHQHMIIGQGQLDSILNSRPEDRRAVIEEAAGVLKHRRRKERAERRLATTAENLERLGDLVREVRRQMRPLERQAAAARSYTDVESDLQAVRRALFSSRRHAYEARKSELEATLQRGATAEREKRHELVLLDAQATRAAAEMASRREEILASTLGQLQGLGERARGLASVIIERRRRLREALDASFDENVIATLEGEAARLVAEQADIDADELTLEPQRVQLAEREQEFTLASEQYDATWSVASASNPVHDLEATKAQIATLTRSRDAAQATFQRASTQRDDAQRREEETLGRRDQAQSQLADAENLRSDAAATLASAAEHVTVSESAREAASAALRDVTDGAARATARAEALARALEELSGSGGRAIVSGLEGVLGAFLDLVDVDGGWERAVESAADVAMGAVVVDGRTSARAALQALRDKGGLGLILPAPTSSLAPIAAPAGTVLLRDHVRPRSSASSHFTGVLDALFGRTVVAENWESAIDVAVAHPELVVVTRDGDRFAGNGWRVASGRALVTRSSVEEADAAATDAQAKVAPATEALRAADQALRAAREAHQAAQLAQVKTTNEVERLRRELSRSEADLVEIAATLEKFRAQVAESDAAVAQLNEELTTETARLPQLEAAAADADQRAKWADEAKATLDAKRESVAELRRDIARLESSLTTRRQVNKDRLAEVERRLAGHAAEREVAAERRRRLEFELEALGRLEQIVEIAAEDVRTNQAALESTYREQLEASRASAERLEEIRRRRATVDAELTELTESTRRADIELAELTVKLSGLAEAVQRDLHGDWEILDEPVELELPEGVTLEQRLAELEARLSSLGPINPLALEELTALEERYKDLDAQVADVRHARRELQEAIRALDDEIMQTFTSAFADVNEHFSALIAMLFPGGQGRLSLTEPDDPLNTGVEIEVRPMGRNVRRVSLLSGGERSMAALAFLFSTFRSRPSPFYMMDEVEAALDDVNLQRFLSLVAEFRDEAQLLIVTHQKRTMEAADALYGVTMVPGGSSKVVSQRVTGKLQAGSE